MRKPLTVLGLTVILLAWAGIAEVLADYEYDNVLGSYWSLADKASSLDIKADYLNKFVQAIYAQKLAGYNAIWLKTPDNSLEQNIYALQSLQTRMNEIRGMDVQSFAYQQAIQQITAQEQGEASRLIHVIHGRWYLDHHPLLWDWINGVKWAVLVLTAIGSGIWLLVEFSW